MTDNHSQFDESVAANYDRYLGPVLFEPFAVDLANRCDVVGDAVVLELACGTGILTTALRRALPASTRLVASDVSPSMLDIARPKLGDHGSVSWTVADACALPFAPGSFDVIVCQFGLMFVPDKARALAQMRVALRPHGKLLLSVWGPIETNRLAYIAHTTLARVLPIDPPTFYEVPFNLADTEPLLAMLRRAGFDHVASEVVSKIGECASAHDVARGLVYGNPVPSAIRERGGDVDAVVDSIAAEVERECGSSPMRASMKATVVTATCG